MRKESTESRSEFKAGVGAVGGLGAKPGPEADPGVAGGGGDGVSGKGEIGAQIRLGQRYRLRTPFIRRCLFGSPPTLLVLLVVSVLFYSRQPV